MNNNRKDTLTALQFGADCRGLFSFLEKEYGYKPTVKETSFGVLVQYKGPKLAVQVYWSTYDAILKVDIVRLIGRAMPPYPILLAQHGDLFWLALNDLVASHGGKQVPVQFPNPIDSRTAVKTFLSTYAEQLERFGKAELSGDTSLFNSRYARVKENGGFSSGPSELTEEAVEDWGRRKIKALERKRETMAKWWKK